MSQASLIRASRNNAVVNALRRYWPGWLGLLLVAALLATHLLASHNPAHSGALNRLDALLYDWRFQLLPPQRPARLPIVIVDLDEATQRREGRWPWDRAKVADLVLALQQHGAGLIGFDVVFSEPGVNPAQVLLAAPDLHSNTRQALRQLLPDFDGDSTLAATLGSNVLLGYFFHADGGKVGALPFPFLELPEQDIARSALISLPDYTSNLHLLTENALSSGFVVAVPDADGIVRRMPLAMRYNNGVYASLTLEMARVALGAPWIRLAQAENGGQVVATSLQIGKHVQVPVDGRAQMLVPYRGRAGSYPSISATGILRGDAPAEQLQALDGALVLVGTSALGLSDLRTVPLQTGYPGVEVHANVLDTILQAALGENTFYQQPDWEPGATLLMLVLSGVLLALLLPGRSPVLMLLMSGGWLVLIVGANLMLWRYAHFALPLSMQVLMVLALTGFNIAAGYLKTNRQKRAIQTLFGEYVPAAYVERMVAHPDLVSLEGEQREMTVLFADVLNFTAMSEALSATELKDLLNRYLTAVTQVIFEHSGTIDKYVGDMVMAFWNAPLDDASHANHAVGAALQMQQRMTSLRAAFQQDGLPVFDIGIGLNTGLMNVGDMGSSYRRAYTVMGDAVNLGARLEGVTRFYGSGILVSDATRQQASEFLYCPVDRIRVKGKREAIDIYEPLCRQDQAPPELIQHMHVFQQALEHYRERRWVDARELLTQLLQQDEARRALYALYLQRMASTDPASLPLYWDAVYDHENK
ncbi:MAG: adenylate/guanylate cyclase domain-containing protein [Burkholderiaceae bacterium]|nr:adenylate/guanylate cyclase domain-containing protein [Burkholderiaceae bacterium]